MTSAELNAALDTLISNEAAGASESYPHWLIDGHNYTVIEVLEAAKQEMTRLADERAAIRIVCEQALPSGKAASGDNLAAYVYKLMRSHEDWYRQCERARAEVDRLKSELNEAVGLFREALDLTSTRSGAILTRHRAGNACPQCRSEGVYDPGHHYWSCPRCPTRWDTHECWPVPTR